MHTKWWLTIFLIIMLFLLFNNDRNVRALSEIKHEITDTTSLSVIQSSQEAIEFRFVSPEINYEQATFSGDRYLKVSIPGAQTIDVPGKPQLPKITKIIILPPTGIPTVTIQNDVTTTISNITTIYPATSIEPIKEPLTPGVKAFYLDESFYTSNFDYPKEIVNISQIAWIRNYRVLVIELHPVQYNPSKHLLTWHKNIDFNIQFNNPLPIMPTNVKHRETSFDQMINAAVLNPEESDTWRADLQEGEVKTNSYFPSTSLGPRFRIPITEDGIYKISYTDLENAGINPDEINPNNISLYNQGEEVAIYVHGESDGKFGIDDYIVFYGESFSGDRLADRYAFENTNWYTYTQQLPDGSTTQWHPQINHWFFEKYTNENVYWLVIKDNPNIKRMEIIDGNPSLNPNPPEPFYTTTKHIEQPKVYWTYHFTSEDTFVWDGLNTSTPTSTYTISLFDPITNSISATLKCEVVAFTNNSNTSPDHHIKIMFNDANVTDSYWDGMSRIHIESDIDPIFLQNGENKIVANLLFDSGIPYDRVYTDWFEIEYIRPFFAVDDHIIFQNNQTGDKKYSIVRFSDTSDIMILDVTDPLNPSMITNPLIDSDSVTFSITQQNVPKKYAISNNNSIKTIPAIEYYAPPSLFNESNQAEYLVISPSKFIIEAQQLADYRASLGMISKVVDFQDIINEFNDGIYHPIAIKNFLAYTLEHWAIPPIYVVLIGDGDWALQPGIPYYGVNPTYMPPYLALVDPWQGEVDSSNLLATVVGDDPFPDMIISRIPVNNNDELETIIDKIVSYEQSPIEDWQNNMLFISDNVPDSAGDFVAANEKLIDKYIDTNDVYHPLRIYENDFDCSSYSDPDCNLVRTAITETISFTGTSLINYIGHGSISRWSHESIFNNNLASTLKNYEKLPVSLSMTCLDGVWQYPPTSRAGSGLEETNLRFPNGGIVGAFSPTGLGVSTGHEALDDGFFESLFNNHQWRLGDASLFAKLKLFLTGNNYDLLHTFTVFGDPALTIKNRDDLLTKPFDFVSSKYLSREYGGPGDFVEHTFVITNTGLTTDTYLILVNNPEWNIVIDPSSQVGPIAPQESIKVSITVLVPSTAQLNDINITDITINSMGDVNKNQHVFIETVVNHQYIYLPLINR